ncbi:hypothetical protein HWV62_21836 [Athelia sp. TMB]|nr:hypothetical protein HWV62_21836 [Athelia sp. TMB]
MVLPQTQDLFESLLPFRILAHATLALIWLPMVVAYITLEYEEGYPLGCLALIAYVIFGVVGVMDYIAMTRKVNNVLFVVVDSVLILVLPVCMWDIAIQGFYFATDFQHYDEYDDTIDVEYGILTLIPAILSLIYIAALGGVAAYHKRRGIQSLSYASRAEADDPALSHKEAMSQHCSYFLHHHSYFRKHSFEPGWLAVIRGGAAVLACIGLIIFSVYSGFSEQEAYSSGSRRITETSIPVLTAAYASDSYPYPSLSVTVSTLDLSTIPADFVVQENTGTALTTYSNQTDPSGFALPTNRVYYCPTSLALDSTVCNYYPFEEYTSAGMGFSVGWSGTTDMVLWPTVSTEIAWIYSVQVSYTDPLVLSAGFQYHVLLTIVSYKRGNTTWLYFDSEVISSVASTDSTTTATFTFRPFQNVIVQQDLSAQSVFVLVVNILSSIGGIFAAIDGVYAIIFGRTILAIITGSRPISPFGLFGIAARKHFKNAIRDKFPRMRADIEGLPDTEDEADIEKGPRKGNLRRQRPGMAAYVNEVAIDTGFVWSDKEAKEEEADVAGNRTDINKRNRVSRLSTQKSADVEEGLTGDPMRYQ